MTFEDKRDQRGGLIPWICPRCSKTTKKYPALSRRDDKTGICPECGVDEAMFDFVTAVTKKKR